MEKILITFGTTPFAQRIGKLLSSKFAVYYASSEPFPDLLLKQRYHRIPTGANPVFVHELLKCCMDESCQFVLPLGNLELKPLLEAKVLFAEYDITVLIPEELDNQLVMDNPQLGLDIRVFDAGIDLLTEERLTDPTFSGVGLLSDDDHVPVLCLI